MCIRHVRMACGQAIAAADTEPPLIVAARKPQRISKKSRLAPNGCAIRPSLCRQLAGWIRIISAPRTVIVVVIIGRACGCRTDSSGADSGSGRNAWIPAAAAPVAASGGITATIGATSVSDAAATKGSTMEGAAMEGARTSAASKRPSLSGDRRGAQDECGSNRNDGSI